MRCYGLPAAIILAAIVIGCGPGKELPPEVSKPETTRSVVTDPLGDPPTRSDPEAKAVLDQAVKAITENDPSRLAKVKTSAAVYKGGVHFPTNPLMTDATLRLQINWLDHALVKYEFREPVVPTLTFRFIHPNGWLTSGREEVLADPAEWGRIISTDLTARYAIGLGLPLANPNTIAAEVKKTDGTTSVKVVPPNMPLFLVTFDDKTHLPVRVEVNPVERNARVFKAISFGEHKPWGGFVIPTTMEVMQNGKPAEKWTLEKWEFPEKLDPTVFEAPR